ncbi:exodeoxyribonuclease III [Zavarzinia compransoris]|uniref:Exodeoxyribonuclease III n=1 Tax=Zavarzinia compransoris TaxID=1264899 RepID=A0A317EE77_9PROT|nr:exodeoxyribonuclease III [Zavarzinia compransoris]PWR23653.1 exodeoxyribonuclease III [Zavarzinia compransoris]TDP47871.1 exodeoxyribonuclease-3 [Zavarzinia compransoris]
MRVASFNVNSVKARLGNLVDWLRAAGPDVVCLQELKTLEMPVTEVEDAGYNVRYVGQKSYNGVAILARDTIEIEEERLPGEAEDEQARYLQALIGGRLRVASIYLPNGNPVETEKFPYKLRWMARLRDQAEKLLAFEEPLVLAGDYNVCPTDGDCYDPAAFRDDALCQPESRAAFRRLLNLGLMDALMAIDPGPRRYTYWDYQARAFERNNGLRIDHLLLSPQAADRLLDAGVDRTPREKERPSDHTPVWCELDL